ncbi:hypothetical protein KPH14_008293 [Odynerus spinipes]|uniref:Cilia- and flagella-associated protein 43 n=1 Tax=Odynerus spinipes TaxID=1348599 RepID=A0AAD9RGH7_9HYME|nr:hypothetical protein KPH14_008293 [Odynerus spinipes]
MFCVAGKDPNPIVRVFAYPGMNKISSCTNTEKLNGYLSCNFAGTDYLLGLTTFPNFTLVIWSWRTGDQIFAKNTKIEELVQTITCSTFSPHAIAQFAQSTGKLAIYQMCICSKTVTLYPTEIKSFERKLTSVCWTTDGNILLCDEFCDIFLMSADGRSRNVIVKGLSNCATLHRYPFVVNFQNGLVFVDTQNEISFYRKLFTTDPMYSWQKIWSLQENKRFVRVKAHNQRDSVLLHDECGQISEISMLRNDVPCFETIYADGIEYKELIPIASRSTHFVVIDQFHRLSVIDSNTGHIAARVALKSHGRVICANAHPMLPIISTSSVTGNCLLIDIFANVPKILTCFHLHTMSLDKMKFSNDGKLLGVANSRVGLIFVIGPNLNEGDSTVIRFIKTKIKIADFLIYDRNDDVTKILILPVTDINAMAGNKLILYRFITKENFEEEIECVIDLLSPFKSLQYGHRRDIDIIGVPYLSKQLHRMEIKNDFGNFVLTEALPSMHKLKNIRIYVGRDNLITFGYDGLIVMRDNADLRRVTAIFMSHHRNDGGIKSAIVLGETIVSLGKNGDLIANKLWHRHVILETNEGENRTLRSPNLRQEFVDFTFDIDKLYSEGKDTYLENIDSIQSKKEKDEALTIRQTILLDVEKLRNKIKDLLDSNEKETMQARLPISCYDLDVDYRNYKIEKARLEREELERRYKEEIDARNKVYRYLRNTFWDPERVHSCSLRSIFGETIIKNYPLSIVNVEIDNFHTSEGYTIDILDIISSLEKYQSSDNENDKKLLHSSKHEASTSNIKHDCKSVDRFYESTDADEKLRLSGTTAHKWIRNEALNLIHQLKRTRDVFLKKFNKNSITRGREYLLMNYFNDRFDEMRSLKEQEIETAKKRAERLKLCAFDINAMFGDKRTFESVAIPVWHHSEIPDYVITVEDNEVSAILYVHPKDESSHEEENSIDRQTKSDSEDYDFYGKALEKMMDGVLDRRWEDEIKRDIPKPACLLTNKPRSKFTPEDIKAVESYESKMAHLRSERQKYRSMLEIEMREIRDDTSKSFASFDEKLKHFETTRIAIESSILQEKLIRLRDIRRHRHICEEDMRIKCFKQEKIASTMKKVRRLAQDCSTFETIVIELKNRYETLVKREKALEGRFRSEFANLKQPMVEHLLRHYKKRPRIGNLACTSVTYLTELGKCVIGNEKPEILPVECTNFLRALYAMDSMPDNLPPLIDDVHWRTMCKLRRTKIEMEMKVRCCAVELAEAEQTLFYCQKSKQTMHSELCRLKIELEEREKKLVRYVEDPDIQLVMKMGQVEVPLQGQGLKDFQDIVLISRRELLAMNEEIERAGKRKLAAMSQSIDLRKKISYQEWRHECLRLTLKHLQDESKSLREVKITKDLQKYLMELPIVKDPKKEYDELERNSHEMKNRYEKLLNVERDRLENVTKEINHWRGRNVELTVEIERAKVRNRELATQIRDPSRKRDLEFRRKRLATIMRRTELVTEIQDNYDELLTLHARLESLRLRTYPTLQFNMSH